MLDHPDFIDVSLSDTGHAEHIIWLVTGLYIDVEVEIQLFSLFCIPVCHEHSYIYLELPFLRSPRFLIGTGLFLFSFSIQLWLDIVLVEQHLHYRSLMTKHNPHVLASLIGQGCKRMSAPDRSAQEVVVHRRARVNHKTSIICHWHSLFTSGNLMSATCLTWFCFRLEQHFSHKICAQYIQSTAQWWFAVDF